MTVLLLSVTLILLFLLPLIQKTDVRIFKDGILKLELQGTLFSLTLPLKLKRKSKKRRQPSAKDAASAARFLIKRAEIKVRRLVDFSAFPLLFGAYSAIISVIFAYFSALGGKITLSDSVYSPSFDGGEGLDVTLTLRPIYVIAAAVIYKSKKIARRIKKCRKTR